MGSRGTTAAAAAALLAIGLAACGGGNDSKKASAPPATTSSETTTTPAPAPTKGGLTPPGTQLAIGKTATLGWAPPSLSLKGKQKTIKVEATVVSLKTGSQSDLKGVTLDADQKGSTPWYLTVRVRSLGARAPKEDNPANAFDAFDDRKQQQGSVTFIGDFPACEEKTKPEPFAKGKSFESCLTYLIPPGGKIAEVRWNEGPAPANGVSPYFEHPVVWK